MGKDKERRAPLYGGSVSAISSSNTLSTLQISRHGFADAYGAAVHAALEARQQYKVVEMQNNVLEDVTPHLLLDNAISPKLMKLTRKLYNAEMEHEILTMQPDVISQTLPKNMGSTKFNMDDIISVNASSNTFLLDDVSESEEEEQEEDLQPVTYTPPYIKIVLRRTDIMLFFEQPSKTVARGTIEAEQVEADNKAYDNKTIGKGRMRRTTTSETQTINKHIKCRETNTHHVRSKTQISYVSNYLMFNSLKNQMAITSGITARNSRQSVVKKNEVEEILQKNDFKIALMKTLRMLAGNVFHNEQRRFRNINTISMNDSNMEYQYNLNVLFQFSPQSWERQRRSIADLAFCPGNGDIIAVAYGIYSFGYMHVPDDGYCCVWNIKNPVSPERKYYFNSPAVSVQFSPSTPQLLAIGLYDGTVEIHDITTFSESPVAISLHDKTATWDPITAIEWVIQTNVVGAEHFEIEPLLALSQDGSVIKYRIINSPYLLAFKQMQLDRIEGAPEGLRIKRVWNQTQSNRFPQGLNIRCHPEQHDIYYILTDEGCIHKCSTNYPHQHLEVLQAHIGSVNEMDFSPWSPKLFLTCGNDWCIRIWLDGILEPLITLQHKVGPVHCAAWSKTHSTVIITNTRTSVDIWDIRRGILKPVTSSQIDKAILTMFKFSRCGRSIAVGNEKGSVLVLAVDDVPFAPHFQYDELEQAIFKCIAIKPNLTNEVKSMGFFGYHEHNMSRRKRGHCTIMH